MNAFPGKLLAVVLVVFTLTYFGGFVSSPALAASHEPTAYTDEIETYLYTQMERYKIPGLAIAIVRNGEVEYTKGFGIANSRGEVVTPDTPFLLNSVSKSFTAVGIMQLVDEGKINLNDPVQKHLPWFAVSSGQGSEITVAQLLHQTSGFSELSGRKALLEPDAPDALEAGVRDLAQEKLAFNPGEGWEYSNLNYNLLGLLILEVSGQTYEDYIEDNIFAPLEMQHSYTSMSAAREAGAASGYYPFLGIPLVFDWYMISSRGNQPSGGIWSSVSDMSHYLIAHLNSGQYGDVSLLSTESTTTLHQPGHMHNGKRGYAMAWGVNYEFLSREQLKMLESDLKDYDKLTVLSHNGDNVNYRSFVFMIPELDYGVVILMNMNNPSVMSALDYFAWDATLIATGGEAQYFGPSEDFMVRYSRWLFGGINLLLVFGLVGSLRVLKKTYKGNTFNKPAVLLSVALPIILSTALIVSIFFMILPDMDMNLPLLFMMTPDLGIFVLLILLISIGWSVASTVLLGLVWTRQRSFS
jgi:CubicO group peptidase (beta-lactamase class C family)